MVKMVFQVSGKDAQFNKWCQTIKFNFYVTPCIHVNEI